MSATKTGTPASREAFGQHLERDGLAGAGRAGDQAVAVGESRSRISNLSLLPTMRRPDAGSSVTAGAVAMTPPVDAVLAARSLASGPR